MIELKDGEQMITQTEPLAIDLDLGGKLTAIANTEAMECLGVNGMGSPVLVKAGDIWHLEVVYRNHGDRTAILSNDGQRIRVPANMLGIFFNRDGKK